MLQLKNISLQVEEEKHQKEILHGIDLTVEDNSFVVITGPNGGGKSTLAKVVAGIETPQRGQILYEGQDITSLDITERARLGIGFALQQPVRFKGLAVFDLLSIAAGKELSVDEACEYLARVGLCAMDYINRELNASLSGGELKRIEIASVMARAPRLSVFDEPEAGIDLWSFQNLIRVFETMRDASKGAVVIISHQERILQIADKIVVIADGRVQREGPRADILPGLLQGGDDCRFYNEEVRS